MPRAIRERMTAVAGAARCGIVGTILVLFMDWPVAEWLGV